MTHVHLLCFLSPNYLTPVRVTRASKRVRGSTFQSEMPHSMSLIFKRDGLALIGSHILSSLYIYARYKALSAHCCARAQLIFTLAGASRVSRYRIFILFTWSEIRVYT